MGAIKMTAIVAGTDLSRHVGDSEAGQRHLDLLAFIHRGLGQVISIELVNS